MLTIYDLQRAQATEVEILSNLLFDELAVIQVRWNAYRKQQVHGGAAPDWDWKQKRLHVPMRQVRIFGLRCAGQVQGLVALETKPRQSEAGDSVYVRFLESAPWNRRDAAPRRYSGAGAALVALAIAESEACGQAGRICLHALPGSESFYNSLGFRRGRTENGYAYLELTPQAQEDR